MKSDNDKSDSSRKNTLNVFLPVLVAALIGAGGTLFVYQGRISKLEGTIEQLRSAGNQTAAGNSSPVSPTANPNDLIAIIKDQQKKNVKESSGEQAWQAFTTDNLNDFREKKTAESITDSLKHDPSFLEILRAIRGMEPGERSKLLLSADKPLHRTWAELGHIGADGQTEAGQQAERIIARAIVDLVEQLVQLPQQEFLKLYR